MVGIKAFHGRYSKSENGCWNWNGVKDEDGYGRIYQSLNGKHIYHMAHRASYFIHFGIPESGILICHRCDNPSCVNPEHLFCGTPMDNMNDRDSKGRQMKGVRHWCCKLDEEKVIAIRELYSSGIHTHESLSNMFGVYKTAIGKIVNRQRWKHI